MTPGEPVDLIPPQQSDSLKPNQPKAWLPKVMVLGGLILMVLAILGLALTNHAPTSNSPELPASTPVDGIARVGDPMRDFTLVDLSGKKVKLSDYAGRPVLINAWATWCPPCQAEMPDLNTFYQKYRYLVLSLRSEAGIREFPIDKTRQCR